ncbi:MAG: DUF177 domain-containing protein [Verrucomicrobiota bacterium]|nr:DUF177 domain-containing protein [Verrucomicrobiota bacterium]
MNNFPELCVHQMLIPPEGMNLSGSISAKIFGEIKGRVFLKAPLQYDLHIEKMAAGTLIKGSVKTKINCICDRCLQPFEQEISSDEVCHFIENTTDDIIDLTNDIREDTLLCIPQTALCSTDCKGICPQCGKNQNNEKCKCTNREENNQLSNLGAKLMNELSKNNGEE